MNRFTNSVVVSPITNKIGVITNCELREINEKLNLMVCAKIDET